MKLFPPLENFMLLRIGYPTDTTGKKPHELDSDLIKSYKKDSEKNIFFKLERRS